MLGLGPKAIKGLKIVGLSFGFGLATISSAFFGKGLKDVGTEAWEKMSNKTKEG